MRQKIAKWHKRKRLSLAKHKSKYSNSDDEEKRQVSLIRHSQTEHGKNEY